MVTVGAFAVARWWWVVFAGAVPDAAIRHALLGLGVVTALLGAVMCASQRHLKRLLAYSTVAHSGIIACGLGLLSGPGLAAAGLYAAGHACTKGALFLVTGELLARYETLDEHELHRRGRGLRGAGVTFLVGALALAGLPPLGTWSGKAAFSQALREGHAEWLEAVLVLVSALTGGAVLRAGLGIFLGLGEPPDPKPDTHEQPEGDPQAGRHALRVRLPPAALLVVGVVLAVVPGIAAPAGRAGAALADTAGYRRAVLHGVPTQAPQVPLEPWWHLSTVAPGILAVVLAAGFAAAELWPSRRPRAVGALLGPVRTGVRALHAVHRAHVGDYVSWVLVGFAVLGATLLLS
jgi:multicomponent Na+:H+ antiporter subunit D